jgi:hypothetical protein
VEDHTTPPGRRRSSWIRGGGAARATLACGATDGDARRGSENLNRLDFPHRFIVVFFIFYFCFLQKYIFDLEIYRNIPRPPRCRAV